MSKKIKGLLLWGLMTAAMILSSGVVSANDGM
jgi:hypothetical protein